MSLKTFYVGPTPYTLISAVSFLSSIYCIAEILLLIVQRRNSSEEMRVYGVGFGITAEVTGSVSRGESLSRCGNGNYNTIGSILLVIVKYMCGDKEEERNRTAETWEWVEGAGRRT